MLDGVFKIQLDVEDDIVIDDLENQSPLMFEQLEVFMCESWTEPAPCLVKNLTIRGTPNAYSQNYLDSCKSMPRVMNDIDSGKK